jgi:hypothetical protein
VWSDVHIKYLIRSSELLLMPLVKFFDLLTLIILFGTIIHLAVALYRIISLSLEKVVQSMISASFGRGL